MLLNRISPFHALGRDLDRLLDGFVPANGTSAARFPRVTIQKTDTGFELRAQVPGVTAENLEVTVHGNRVTLRGKTTATPESVQEGFLLREWQEREFERAFDLPVDLDNKSVAAELKDGVLRLELPLAADQQPQKIQIATAG